MPDPAAEPLDPSGRHVLIAETNPLIAMDVAATICGWGADPLLYYELDSTRRHAAVETAFAALIDVPDAHPVETELIDRLRASRVPTVLTTAGRKEFIADTFPDLAIFEKPVDYAALQQWFAQL
jgi:hypothetical protein